MTLETTVNIICAVSVAASAVVICFVFTCIACKSLVDWISEKVVVVRKYATRAHSEYRRKRFLKYMAKKRG